MSAGARVASVRAAVGDRPPTVRLADGRQGSGFWGLNLRVMRCMPAGARVASVRAAEGDRPPTVRLAGGGETAAPRGVVVATEAPEAAALLGDALADSPSKREPGVGTACVYFRRACGAMQKVCRVGRSVKLVLQVWDLDVAADVVWRALLLGLRRWRTCSAAHAPCRHVPLCHASGQGKLQGSAGFTSGLEQL